MAVYATNKGIGKETEFKGFQGTYIYYLAGIALGSFFLFIVLHFVGIPDLISIIAVIAIFFFSIIRLYQTNKKYGLHGLSQKGAKSRRPKQIKAEIAPFKSLIRPDAQSKTLNR